MTARLAPDSQLEEVLTLENFQQDHFDLHDFVSTISDKLIAKSVQNTTAPFDPLPFLQTFSHSVDSLLKIRKDVQSTTDLLESDVRKAEKDYGRRLEELDKGFDHVGTSFSSLESRISSVGRTAIRIGETLETLHLARHRAQASSVLLSYYLALARGETAPLERLVKNSHREGREGRIGRETLATVLRRLQSLVKEDAAGGAGDAAGGGESTPGGKGTNRSTAIGAAAGDVAETRKRIEGFCERFEKEILGLFDRWYRKGDPKMMAHCARVLLEFNGGGSCIQIYVNQHDFFISKDRLAEVNAIGEGELWQTIADPQAPPPKSEPTLEQLYEEIRLTVSQEAQIIQAVFPNPPVVMQVFIQRVFAQVIQPNIEALLEKASSLSTLASLRILALAHSFTVALIDDLKAYDFSSTNSGSAGAGPKRQDSAAPDMVSALGRAGSGAAAAAAAGGMSLVAATLERCMEDLFGPYLEGLRYLERESKSLGELYTGHLHRFTRYHETVHKAKPNKLFDRVVNQLASTAGGPSSSTSSSMANLHNYQPSTTQQAAAAILKYSGVRPEQQNADEAYGVQDEDGSLMLEMGERMLRWHAEAIGRCVELSSSGDVPKNAFALLRVLAEALGRSYLETALDSALSKLDPTTDSKFEPDLVHPLAVLQQADLLVHLWQRYCTTALVPLASGSGPVRRELASFHATSLHAVESKTNALVGRVLDAIHLHLSFLLTKQKKLDFKPKNDDLSFERVSTEPCLLAVEFLDRIRERAREALTGKNVEGFLTEVGIGFHNLLLEHLKKFPVSVTGALMLTKDLASYQDAVALFGLPPVSDRFAMLRQLGNLFVVQPEVLRSFMREGHLGRVDPALLRPYLMMRGDWSVFGRRFLEEEGVAAGEVAAAASSSSRGVGMVERLGAISAAGTGQAMRSGLSRLGGMMKELESYSAFSGPDERRGNSGRETPTRKPTDDNSPASHSRLPQHQPVSLFGI